MYHDESRTNNFVIGIKIHKRIDSKPKIRKKNVSSSKDIQCMICGAYTISFNKKFEGLCNHCSSIKERKDGEKVLPIIKTFERDFHGKQQIFSTTSVKFTDNTFWKDPARFCRKIRNSYVRKIQNQQCEIERLQNILEEHDIEY